MTTDELERKIGKIQKKIALLTRRLRQLEIQREQSLDRVSFRDRGDKWGS